MKRKLTSLLLILILATSSLLASACGNSTTLARIGAALGPLGTAFDNQLLPMLQSKVIDQKKYDTLKAFNVPQKAKDIGQYLTNLSVVTSSNKQEVINAIQGGVDLFQKVAGVLPVGSTAARIIAVATAVLDGARVAVAILNPPAASTSFALGQPEKGISTKAVKVNLPEVPPEVKAALEAAKK